MGYSNNKWRKILTILMIINLCFILFAKFSKVFGAYNDNKTTIEIDSTNYDIAIDYLTQNYSYYIFASRTINRQKNLYLFCSNDKMIFNDNSGTSYDQITFDSSNQNKTFIQFQVYRYPDNYTPSFSSLVDTWNNTEFDPSLNTHTYQNSNYTMINQTVTSIYSGQNISLCYSNYDVKNANGDIIHNNNTNSYPFFTNNTEIEQCSFTDGIYINPGDFENTDNIYFHLLEITNGLANGDTSLYYYSDKIFALDKNSNYYSTYADPNIDLFYYYIPKYKLGLSQNTSYLYVLNNSKSQIQNSNGVIEKDVANGIYDVVESDTTGIITATEEENDRLQDIQSTITENNERIDNIDDSLSNTTVNQDTETDIDGSLSFNNSTPQFTNLFNSYFSRLTSLVADLGNYQDNNVITINLPVPHSNSTIPIRSDILSSHIPADIYFIIQMVWFFIFGRYYLKFLLKVYHLVSTGLLLDYYSLSGEVITQDML